MTGTEKNICKQKNGRFEAAAEEWFTFKKPLWKESTAVKYRNFLNIYILPALGKISLEELTTEDVELLCSDLLFCGGNRKEGLSPKTVSDILSVIRNILKYNSEIKKLSLCDLGMLKIRQQPKKLRVFSRNETEKLCRFLYADQNIRNTGILLCLFTGIRIGELCALRWEDISFEEQTLRICQTMQRIQNEDRLGTKTKIIVTPPKSCYSIRTIPLAEQLTALLESYRHTKGYFLTGSVQKFVEPRTMQNHFKRVLKECSIENANFHCLRHTFATCCIELGVDVKSLSELLGHSSVTITMNRYVHPSMELKRKQIRRLAESFVLR